MSAGTHTPGPWMFRHDVRSGDNGIYADGTGIFAEVFADIRRAGENARDEAGANARLMAAAPDMLAAGKLCPDRADFGTANAYADAVDAWWRNEMLPAIAKAESRS